MKTKEILLTTVLLLSSVATSAQSLLVDDFEPPRTLFWNPIGDGVELEIVDNPCTTDFMNRSSKVLKVSYIYSDANRFAGVILGNIQGLNIGDTGEGNMRYAHVKFYKEIVGESGVKVQGGHDGSRELSRSIPIGEWQEVVFDFNFSEKNDDIAIGSYNEIYIIANSTELEIGTQVILYIDDVTFSNDPKIPNGIPNQTDELAILDNFENGLINFTTKLNEMEGMSSLVVNNPQKRGINTSNKVLAMTRLVDKNAWAGFWSVLSPDAALRCNLDKYKYAHFKILQNQTGASAKFKVERTHEDFLEKEPMEQPSKINEWEEIIFDLSDGNGLYSVIALMPDYAENRPAHVIYIDDLQLSSERIVAKDNSLLAVISSIKVLVDGGSADVLFVSEQAKFVCLTLYNEAGQQIAQCNSTALVGENRIRFSIAQKGFYFVKVDMGNNQGLVTQFVR